MAIVTAGWGGIGTLLLVIFVILPSIRWSVGFGTKFGPRWARRHGYSWPGWDGDVSPGRSSRREIAELRAELESRLGEIDALTSRVAELENRADFAERLLSRRGEVVSLPTGGSTEA